MNPGGERRSSRVLRKVDLEDDFLVIVRVVCKRGTQKTRAVKGRETG